MEEFFKCRDLNGTLYHLTRFIENMKGISYGLRFI